MLGSQNIASQTTLLSVETTTLAIEADTERIAFIEPETDKIADIETETNKIDIATTDGLAGIDGSTAYRAHEVDRHIHGWERWFGLAGAPAGETHVADRIGTTGNPFRLDAGNNTWGAWVQILGSTDTPAEVGMVEFDLHRLDVKATERNEVYFVQIALGASGAAALSSGDYTEVVFKPASNQIDSGPIVVHSRRKAVSTKAWARCMCPGQNTATFDFFPGVHEYEG